MTESKYQSPQQLIASGKYPFTIGQLRNYLLIRHRNGLDKAVRKVGKRIVLRVDLFEQWIESHKE